MKNNNIVIMVVVAIIIAGGAFFAGIQYQKSQAAAINTGIGGQYARGGGFGGQGGNNRFGARGGVGGGATVGQIVSADANSITVKLPDGSSKIVNITSDTKITKSASASVSDLTTGAQVAAFGTPNSDGSINAQTVQLNPQMFRRPTGQGTNASGNPAPTQ